MRDDDNYAELTFRPFEDNYHFFFFFFDLYDVINQYLFLMCTLNICKPTN